MAGAEYVFIANIKGPRGNDGGAGPQGERGLTGPTGLPGVNAVENDTAVAAYVTSGSSATGAAVASKVNTQIARVDIRSYINTGETLNSTGGAGNNSAIIQRAIDACNVLYLADGKPRQIFFPDGIYATVKTGSSGSSNYAIRWRSGVGIGTSSYRGVKFLTPADATFGFAAESIGGVQDVYMDPHIVDGSTQANVVSGSTVYTSKFKGYFIQDLKNSNWNDVLIQNCFSTGWGCDYLRNVTGTIRGNGNGRGITLAGIDPLTTSGGSGVGIGTGRFVDESFDLVCYTNNNALHGTFTETQGSEPYPFAAGFQRLRVYATGNHIGFRDCGSNGLESWVTTRGNTYAEILHDKTVLNDVMGINGTCRCNLVGGSGSGIVFGNAATSGAYKFIGEIRNMTSHGVTTKTGAVMPNRVTFDLDISGCGGDAITLDKKADRLTLKVREWSNTGVGLRLSGGGTSALTTFSDCDFSGSLVITQTLVAPLVSTTSRGVTLTGTAPYYADLLDSGPTGGTDLNGRVASSGSATATWAVSSTGTGTAGISVYAAGTKGKQLSGSGGSATALLTAPTRATKIGAYVAYIKAGATGYWGIVFRYKDASNYWVLRATGQAATWDLIKVAAGVPTTMATAPTAPTIGEAITITDTGSVITVFRNGASWTGGAVTDSTHNDGVKAGIRLIATDTTSAVQGFTLFV